MYEDIPPHLRRFLVAQDYAGYTPIDQAVWRYCMRQLTEYLRVYGHESYLSGLAKTGISIESIPKISEMNDKLQQFGWKAAAVSGFIPPAAFMELQALGVMPIGVVMRTLEHLAYTPAPDIVHEASGHAPIISHPEFADYLRRYAHVARKAIFSKPDLAVYEAIRDLSDLKEEPSSTPEQLAAAEENLTAAVRAVERPSEAALLGRLNWWTAEYGLIGALEAPKIYGAGLLSSVSEGKACLGPKVRKLPLTIECVEYDYDITEPQPQLFVTPDFATLSQVLDQLAARMAFRRGGLYGLREIVDAGTVNTVEYNSGVQVSGVLTRIIMAPHPASPARGEERGVEPVYLQFTGPVQLAWQDRELPGHDVRRHAHGFGAPVGQINGATRCLSEWTPHELSTRGIAVGQAVALEFVSGVLVRGTVRHILTREHRNLVITFTDCLVSYQGEVLFKPEWGEYDMAVGSTIPSVFGGAADREAYGSSESFVAKVIPPRQYSAAEEALHALYARVRRAREQGGGAAELAEVAAALDRDFPDDWLLRLELLELSPQLTTAPDWAAPFRTMLVQRAATDPHCCESIRQGLALIAG